MQSPDTTFTTQYRKQTVYHSLLTSYTISTLNDGNTFIFVYNSIWSKFLEYFHKTIVYEFNILLRALGDQSIFYIIMQRWWMTRTKKKEEVFFVLFFGLGCHSMMTVEQPYISQIYVLFVLNGHRAVEVSFLTPRRWASVEQPTDSRTGETFLFRAW